ncbi:hypothetical protein ACOWOF_05455 [Helicobacter pylori]
MKSSDITLSEHQKTLSEEQILKRLKELTLEKINAICKEKIINEFKSEVLGSVHANEQEVTNTLNANAENIKSEIKKLENQLIETTTKLLTSYQIFLNQARESATNQINTNKTASLEAITQAKTNASNEISNNKTQAITNINEAKTTANNEINTNKQEVLNNITQAKTTTTSEINEAKNRSLSKH